MMGETIQQILKQSNDMHNATMFLCMAALVVAFLYICYMINVWRIEYKEVKE